MTRLVTASSVTAEAGTLTKIVYDFVPGRHRYSLGGTRFEMTEFQVSEVGNSVFQEVVR